MSTTAKQFDLMATLVAGMLTEKAKLLLELPNAAPLRAAVIRREIASIDYLIPLYKN